MTKYVSKKPDKEGIIHFTHTENETWKILYERQIKTIQNRACIEYIAGLKKLNLPINRVPQCPEVSETLASLTGWSVVPVDAIIPIEVFFELLSKRQFPAASFIRVREELDYLQEPDIFHEIFGHCPLLTWQPYADFMQRFGLVALQSDEKTQSILGRLFWFTIEFGLIQTQQGMRVYGSGIISSHEETQFSLENSEPKRSPFDPVQILKTEYRYDVIQKQYFAIKDFSQLFDLDLNEMLGIAKQIADNPFHEKDFVTC
ncbi:MAG: phenylalanine 4-monooxygenase [Gammaproteobacteria bacterium CG_4_10_14_0_8_um_filter_38_16]|nr:MAG: phenylalanine 4-monooxygenase [Gammaproteobacteria bacterium CG_4_10_14_0_8_um_filter_38_16]PJA02724.1 MAG: phenylalanine 4-monooxygenase [Gammaproteobacteria bacterium CG_4_10_14_0_2_um_filter_38_22]PJB09802.1 MAG: phenylalanine 4-monooxygenase [Gammaproteobacteria bacterium CG_4_9_14_3_um_filter_38_9]